jgi:hypothetical protein
MRVKTIVLVMAAAVFMLAAHAATAEDLAAKRSLLLIAVMSLPGKDAYWHAFMHILTSFPANVSMHCMMLPSSSSALLPQLLIYPMNATRIWTNTAQVLLPARDGC